MYTKLPQAFDGGSPPHVQLQYVRKEGDTSFGFQVDELGLRRRQVGAGADGYALC